MGFICLAGTIFSVLNLKALQHKRLSSLSVLRRQSCTKHVKTIILFICRAFFTARESVVVPLQQKKERKSSLLEHAVNAPVVMMPKKKHPAINQSAKKKREDGKKKTQLIVGSRDPRLK